MRHSPERLRQVVDEIRYNRSMLETAELRRGRIAHELLEKGRRVEKDLGVIFQKINQRSEPFYLSATFCSPTFGGLRCQPDAIYVESSGTSLKLLIVEDKTTNQPHCYAQLYAEAVILTDMHCLIAPAFERELPGVGGSSEERRAPFFPKLSGFDEYLVEATLNP